MWCLFGLGGCTLLGALLLALGVSVRIPRLHPSQLLRGCLVLSLIGLAVVLLSCGFFVRGVL